MVVFRASAILLLLGNFTSVAFSAPTALKPWVAARVRLAEQGKREIVRIPLVIRSMGWGCECPMSYIGDNPYSQQGPWIRLTSGSVPPPGYNERSGVALIAEGYFTGRRVEEDLRDKNGEPEEWLYSLWEFHALRLRQAKESDDFRSVLKVLLSGAAAKHRVSPIRDDKPWLVVAGSFPIGQKASLAHAKEKQKKLVQHGFAQSLVLDSRSFSNLACCYHVLLVGRYADKKKATGVMKRVRKKGYEVYLKRGWH